MPTHLGQKEPTSTPLPENEFAPETPLHNAYKQCLDLEDKDSWNQCSEDPNRPFSESIMKEMLPKTVARVLGHALRLAPNPVSCDVLVREIIDCKFEPEDQYVTHIN